MPTETPIPTQYYPDDFGYEFFEISQAEITASDVYLIKSFDRDVVIDSAAIYCSAEDAPSSVELVYDADVATADGGSTSLGTADFSAREWVEMSMTGEVVPAGTFLNLDVTVATGVTNIMLRIRYRTRRN